jgi:hypothetical protein
MSDSKRNLKIQFKDNTHAIKRTHWIDFAGGSSTYDLVQIQGKVPFEVEEITYPVKGSALIMVEWHGRAVMDGGSITYLINVPKGLFEEVK